jgi:hypothetical protein
VDPNIKTTSTLTTPQTNTFTTPPDIHSTDGAPRKVPAEKIVSTTETVPVRPAVALIDYRFFQRTCRKWTTWAVGSNYPTYPILPLFICTLLAT